MREAAAITGVSLCTLRRWADQDRVPSFRSPGGHRRFRTAHLQQALAQHGPAPERPAPLGAFAATEIRQQLAAPRPLPDWLGEIDHPARERLALLGRTLVQMVEDYIGRRRSRSVVLCEGHALGLLYGRELIAARLTLRQGLERFTFFRRRLEDAGRRYAAACPETIVVDDLRDQLDVLNDRLLLGIAEAYDESESRLPAASSAAGPRPRE